MEIEMSSIKLISQSLSVVCHVDLFNACKFAVICRRESPYHGHADDHLIYGSCRDRFRFISFREIAEMGTQDIKLRTHLPKFCTLEYVNKSLLFIESKD